MIMQKVTAAKVCDGGAELAEQSRDSHLVTD